MGTNWSAVVKAEVEPGDVPFDAHQEQSAFTVLMLVSVQDVGVVAVKEVTDGGDDSLAVGAVDQEDAGLWQRHCTLVIFSPKGPQLH